jgi:hypothetical protein
MALGLSALEDLHVEPGQSVGCGAQLEDLPVFVAGEIQGVVNRPSEAEPSLVRLDGAKPRAHAGEVFRDGFGIHNRSGMK